MTATNIDISNDLTDRSLSANDLADLMSSFNEVSAKLQATHETLRAEVKRLNGELRDANVELQRSKRLSALGEMAAGISHEIRNPLGSIKLYARMLEQDLEPLPEQQEIATKIGSAVSRLNEVVTDVLAFSKETRVRLIELDADDVIERAIEACRSLLSEPPEVRIERELEMMADPGLLEQALINLLRNAAEAMVEAGQPASGFIITAQNRIDELTDRPAVVIAVRDRGVGIDPAVIERMFNPFFTTRDTGTGLGLSIVHRIMEAHRGRVCVFNNAELVPDDSGATVELWIPQTLSLGVERAEPMTALSEMERTA